jgi:hypothetical protein
VRAWASQTSCTVSAVAIWDRSWKPILQDKRFALCASPHEDRKRSYSPCTEDKSAVPCRVQRHNRRPAIAWAIACLSRQQIPSPVITASIRPRNRPCGRGARFPTPSPKSAGPLFHIPSLSSSQVLPCHCSRELISLWFDLVCLIRHAEAKWHTRSCDRSDNRDSVRVTRRSEGCQAGRR